MSPAKLRGLGLGAAVAIAVLVPIAASAGPSGNPAGSGGSGGADGAVSAGTAGVARPPADGKPEALLTGLDLGSSRAPAVRGSSPEPPASLREASRAAEPPADSATRCGPELASPDGVEAQTCVVAEGADVWARTYYRNATGRAIDVVLTLMAPGGRTVQVGCAVEARDEPGMCETPQERGRGGTGDYSAVAEFAGAGEGDSTPLLLRSGSNSPETEGS
ncbi:hypothetical protein [Streptomyces sp. NPDC051921]|uniref:hypothetical protein n=1 Tax=Streptomyces sp. NPDC051921 TaxID=3155806 RepID=UPI00342AABD5